MFATMRRDPLTVAMSCSGLAQLCGNWNNFRIASVLYLSRSLSSEHTQSRLYFLFLSTVIFGQVYRMLQEPYTCIESAVFMLKVFSFPVNHKFITQAI